MQFDLMNASANGVLRQLRSSGLDRDSSVSVQAVDTTIADDATLADRARLDRWHRFYHGERAPVWELVQTSVSDGIDRPDTSAIARGISVLFVGFLLVIAVTRPCPRRAR